MERRNFFYVILFWALTACEGTPAPGPTPPAMPAQAANPCGFPPPVPDPYLWLVSPQSGSSNVSTTIGEVIVAGEPRGFYDTAKVNVMSSSGVAVPVGAYTAAPSPSPTPYPTPPGWSGAPDLAVPIPTLAPATTYTLSYTYTIFNNVPPSCTGLQTLPLGTFTTK